MINKLLTVLKYQYLPLLYEIHESDEKLRDENIRHLFCRTIYSNQAVTEKYDSVYTRLRERFKKFDRMILHDRALKISYSLLSN